MLKLMGDSLIRNRVFTYFKVSSHKLLNHKGGNENLQWGSLEDTTLPWGQGYHPLTISHPFQYSVLTRTQHHFCGIRNAWRESCHEETLYKLKLGVIYIITDLYSSKMVGLWKTKAEEIFQIKEDWRETWHLNAMWEPGPGPGPGKKKSYKDKWQNLNLDCGLDDSILSMLNFPILITVL